MNSNDTLKNVLDWQIQKISGRNCKYYIRKQECICYMGTGSGKSLCYQLPGMSKKVRT